MSLSIKSTARSIFAIVLTAALFSFFGGTSQVVALSGSDWQAGNIIDDGIFYDNNAMSAQDIQNFLNSKVPSCDTNGAKIYSGSQTRAQYGTSRGYPPPYTCLKDYSQNGMSAAQIIKSASDTYQVNPKSLIVLLQKEQTLVTDDWPWSSQYRSATGYGCPDTAACDSQYYGYYNQVMNAARQFRLYANNPQNYRYKPYQSNYIQYNPNAGCGGTNVYITNKATAGLYNYTPYQPNASALNNLYGTGDGCGAYGNRNFWRLFNDWFGTVRAAPYAWQYVTQYAYTDSTKTTGVDLGNAARGQRVYVGVQARNVGSGTWTNSGANPVRIGTYNPKDHSSAFCDASWISCNRPSVLKESSVAPGQTGTFEFWYNIPTSGANTREYFNLLAEGNTWMNDLGLYFYIYSAPPTYTWQLMSQYAYSDNSKSSGVDLSNLSPGQRVFVGLRATNTGNVTWTNSGNNPAKLGTNNPQNRNSAFCDPSWASCSRPATLQESSVAPGQTGTFEFWYKAPSTPGSYGEYFRPVIENIAWLNDTSLNFNSRIVIPLVNQNSPDRLNTNQQLSTGGSLNSSNGQYQLVLQSDGNLVLYSRYRATWFTGTGGTQPNRLVMQGDGNLVIYDSQGKPTWYSGTNNRSTSTLILQSDGNLVIYDAQGRATWNSGTNGRI